MNNYQKYRLYKNKYLQLKSGSPCTQYHGKPFRCWKTDGCSYKVGNDQCVTKASLNPLPDETPEELQTRNEGSRQRLKSRQYQKPFYRDAAATLIGNRVRHRQRHRGEAAARVQRAYRRHNRHEISITISDLGSNTIGTFQCGKTTPILRLLEFIRKETGTDLSAINLFLDNDRDEEEPRLFNASNRDEPVSVISEALNISMTMFIGPSDHEKLERFVSELPEKVKPEVKWTHTDILSKLNLIFNQLTQLPYTIGNLTNLTSLDLQYNQLTKLPDTIGDLSNLTRLYILKNQLTKLPDTIGNLNNLRILDLFDNRLTQLPDSIGSLNNLTRLYLIRNQLSQIPDTIGNLTNLTLLNLNFNQLTQLPDTITRLTNLTNLELWDNPLTQLPDTIGHLRNINGGVYR